MIKNGKVFEKGTHDELVSLNGFYTKLNGQYKWIFILNFETKFS